MNFLESVIFTFFSSLIISFLIVLTTRYHASFSLDSFVGIQKYHFSPTPRIGGISIYISLLVSIYISYESYTFILSVISLAGFVAFLFGLAEDVTKKISVYTRLFATIASGYLACLITGYSLTRVDLWAIDQYLQYKFVSLFLTSFAVGGISNSVNIIDGFNGFASLTCIIAFLAFSSISYQVGDISLSYASFILAASVFGFFCVNWPMGKLFLGDGGAYFIGFALSWIAVLLTERNKTVSPFSSFLICILPITEVLFSIFRRILRNQIPGSADSLHFHSLLNRRYVRRWFSHWTPLSRNSIVGLIMGCINLVPAFIAISFFHSTLYCAFSSILFSCLYVLFFLRMVRHHW